ncbi:MAG: glycosyltransferase family 1 protein [Bacteroidetes bacterium]|nr:glycosyltransferase family 1 protein [Bacteroidota bacterium]
MQISFSTLRSNFNTSIGYGYAGQHIINSLRELGHQTPYQDPKAPVQLNFSQPDHFKLHRNQYQISYTPWESTKIPDRWLLKLNVCDEVWTTSDWCANVFESSGFKDVKVYPHGIEPAWTPLKRKESDVIKFLHIGEPAPRKGGQMVVDVFTSLFGNNPKYSLTIKGYKNNTTRIYNNYIDKNIIGLPDQKFNNIKVIIKDLSQEELIKLYHDHDVLVYPTFGEGFGFIPLQALATGMPTISTYDWAHYKKYLGPLKLKSNLKSTEWEYVHPGEVFEPNYQHLVELMKDVANNFNAYSGYYYAQSTKIHEEYNWLQLTNNAFDHIFKKFS